MKNIKILSVLNPSLRDYKLSGAALLGINLGEYLNHNYENISVDFIASSAINDILDNKLTTYHVAKVYSPEFSKRCIIKNTIKYAVELYDKYNYDLIHIHLHQMSVIDSIYDIIPNNIPVVYTQHTSTISGRFSLGYRDKAYKLSCSNNRNIKIICPSYSMYSIWRDYIKTEGSIDNISNVSVIRNGVNTINSNSTNIINPIFSEYYISCGRIDPNKGMLEVAKFCDRYKHDIVLVGDLELGSLKANNSQKEYYNEFKDIVSNSSNIMWIPYVDNQDLLQLIKNSKGYISMSKKESFGLTIAESMSVGTPILFIEESAIKEICNDKVSVMVPNSELYRKRLDKKLEIFEKYFNIFENKISSGYISNIEELFNESSLSIKNCAKSYSDLYLEMVKRK